MYLVSWLVFISSDILCERNLDSAQLAGESQPLSLCSAQFELAGSPHLARQNLSSSHIQAELRKYIKGLHSWDFNFKAGGEILWNGVGSELMVS